jgi:hypothetical protein
MIIYESAKNQLFLNRKGNANTFAKNGKSMLYLYRIFSFVSIFNPPFAEA